MKRIMNKIKEKGAVICAFLLCITSIATMAGCGKLPSSFVTSDKIAVAAFRERYLASIEEAYHNAIAKVEICKL